MIGKPLPPSSAPNRSTIEEYNRDRSEMAVIVEVSTGGQASGRVGFRFALLCPSRELLARGLRVASWASVDEEGWQPRVYVRGVGHKSWDVGRRGTSDVDTPWQKDHAVPGEPIRGKYTAHVRT